MNIKQLLTQWGHWATPRLGTEFPCVAMGILGAAYESKYRVVPIDDDVAMKIDQAVLLIRKVEPVLYDVLMMTYVYRMKPRVIAEKLAIRARKYDELLSIAKTSVKLMLAQKQCLFVA